MSEPLEHVAFGGSYLIDGCLYISYLYESGDGVYGWELIAVDHEGNRTVCRERRYCEDVDAALLWILGHLLDFAMSKGIEPDELQIVQRSCCPTSNPEFLADALGAYHESRTAVHH